MNEYFTNNRVCATCSFWSGPRNIDSFNSKSIVNSGNTQGKCVAPPGVGYRGSDMRAANSCNGWSLWSAIRK